jgi:Ca2+-binding EF-hand superfamily protein
MMAIILLNCILIGVQVQQYAATHVEEKWFDFVEYAFTAIYICELAARIAVHRVDFILDAEERWWNVFDTSLVTLSVVDIIIKTSSSDGSLGSGAFFSKVGRVTRMLRILRIIRTVKFMSQIRILLRMIYGSLVTFFWVLVTLSGFIYVFAIVLTQGATDYLQTTPLAGRQRCEEEEDVIMGACRYDHLVALYGSLFDSMYTLFMCITGGLDWGHASLTLRDAGWFLEAVVIGYILFTFFVVLNILTGVFVDGAIQHANSDRMVMMEKQRAEDEIKEKHLMDLLRHMDENEDNTITFEEFNRSLGDPAVRQYIAALKVDVADAKEFFTMLDVDHSGSVDIVEFVTGMMKLKGQAKSSDMQLVLHENRKLMILFKGLVELLDRQLAAFREPHQRNSDIAI